MTCVATGLPAQFVAYTPCDDESTFVSIRRGGASRYIIAWFHLSKTKGILKELVHAVDVLGAQGAAV